MSPGLWIAWSVVTIAFNAINSANSRAKNSRSLKFNSWTTFAAAFFYCLSILGIGNLLLQAHHLELALAVIAYAGLSTLGSVIGQAGSMKFEASHNIQK